jgi:polyphosphate kinase 2 (PPK2 family)
VAHSPRASRHDIGIFNRSHYEDVTAAYPVIGAIDDRQRKRRYEHINALEKMLPDEGTSVVKVFPARRERRAASGSSPALDDPEKRWNSTAPISTLARGGRVRASLRRGVDGDLHALAP